MKIKGKLMTIPIKKIIPNSWNPNIQSEFIFEKERNSIREHGFIDPVTVRTKGTLFEIIDGEHRWKAAKAEGMTHVTANNLGQIEDSIAKRLTIILNETRGESDQKRLSALLQDLQGYDGVDSLLSSLPFSRVELESILSNHEVDWDQIGPSLNEPVTVIGENTPPQQQSAQPAAVPEPSNPDSKMIVIEVSIKQYGLFFEQINRIKKCLKGEQIDDVVALQHMIEILQQTDVESLMATRLNQLLPNIKRRTKPGN